MLLNFTIAPVPSWNLILFLISAFVIIMGITLFNLGVDMSLIPIGEHIGSLYPSFDFTFIFSLPVARNHTHQWSGWILSL
ncbi:MAG: DUF1538 family protein [Clostridiaceae bacterium]|nr:DUF1538 family protein [Clostridiaceae bacterium]